MPVLRLTASRETIKVMMDDAGLDLSWDSRLNYDEIAEGMKVILDFDYSSSADVCDVLATIFLNLN